MPKLCIMAAVWFVYAYPVLVFQTLWRLHMLKRTSVLAAAALFLLFPNATVQAQGLPSFFAVLNGNNECTTATPPDRPTCQNGDLNGYGSATVTIINSTTVCVAILVDNLAQVIAAHIHSGAATVNGPIVVPPTSGSLNLPIQPSGSNPGGSSTCVSGIPTATVAAIRANPQNFYVNVHSMMFPGGAVRGQLF
jgi:hypothetical protein